MRRTEDPTKRDLRSAEDPITRQLAIAKDIWQYLKFKKRKENLIKFLSHNFTSMQG